MIEIIVSPPPSESGSSQDLLSGESFGRIIDDCERQKKRDIVMHLAAGRIPAWFGEAVEKTLRGPFRLKACFEEGICPDLASQFVAAGQRITFSTAGVSGDAAARAMLSDLRSGGWDSRRTELFIPFPSPSLDLQEFSEAQGLVDSITLGVGWSSATSGPTSVESRESSEWATSLLAVLKMWTEKGITTYFACGFPLCVFTTEQLGRLAFLNVQSPLAKCPPDLVIGPGNTIRSCHRLENTMELTPSATADLAATRDALVAPYAAFRGMCDRDDNPVCRSLLSAGCGGGCLADAATSWTRS